MHAVELIAVTKRFGSRCALNSLSLSADPGEALCLFGPSGCGKTTALRIVAGLELPDSGEVKISGLSASGNGSFMPPAHRGIGMVFQDLALWPHMRVERHLDFVLGPLGLPRGERKRRVGDLLDLCRMVPHARAYPQRLSGGEQQRLAIARAIAAEPPILLLDEPFTGLDAELREAFRAEILRLKREKQTTVLFTTHLEDEMRAMADRTVLMDQPRAS